MEEIICHLTKLLAHQQQFMVRLAAQQEYTDWVVEQLQASMAASMAARMPLP